MSRTVVFLVWRDTRHPEGGGSELFVERIAAGLVRGGDTVTICCARWPGSAPDEIVDGVHLRRRGGRLTVYPRALAYLLGAGRRADVVVDVRNGLPFWSRVVRRRRPVVVLVHHVHHEQWQVIYPGWRGRLGWWLEARAATRLYRHDRYVTVSEASRRDLVALGVDPVRVDVVHNGVDLPRPPAAPPLDAVASRGEVRLGVLCRLVPHKQVEHAIAVTAALADRFPGLQLHVVGDGWWAPHLVEAATGRGIADRVVFHGHVEREHRDALLASFDLLLAPSLKEGWGLSIIEAAALGVPTVAYRSAGGTQESIRHDETGVLVDDLDELTATVARLLDRPQRRAELGDAARVWAKEFSWEESAGRFSGALERAIRERAIRS